MRRADCPYPHIVAHRGGGSLAPENTLIALQTGFRYGHRMVEFDVKLSKDQNIFLLHDDELDRTTTHQGVAGDFDWDFLSQLDAGSWFDQRFAANPLPSLVQIAEFCQRHQIQANIEIKPTPGTDWLTGQQVASVACQLWQNNSLPLLSSFSFDALLAARKSAPELPRGFLMDEWRPDWLDLVQQAECISLHLNHRLLNDNRIRQIRDAGLYILAYTVNQTQCAKQLLEAGVDMICTDRIDLIGPDFNYCAKS